MEKQSAANIKIAKSAPQTDLFKRLRSLLATYGSESNKHERAAMMIEACIVEGINTGKRIIAVLEQFGFNGQHVGIMLTRGDYAHRWQQSAEGIYSLRS